MPVCLISSGSCRGWISSFSSFCLILDLIKQPHTHQGARPFFFFFFTISWIPSHGTHPPLACVAETVQPGAIRACWEGHICSSAVQGLDLIPNWPQIESGVVVRRMLISLRIISGPISPEEWLPWWLRW